MEEPDCGAKDGERQNAQQAQQFHARGEVLVPGKGDRRGKGEYQDQYAQGGDHKLPGRGNNGIGALADGVPPGAIAD